MNVGSPEEQRERVHCSVNLWLHVPQGTLTLRESRVPEQRKAGEGLHVSMGGGEGVRV